MLACGLVNRIRNWERFAAGARKGWKHLLDAMDNVYSEQPRLCTSVSTLAGTGGSIEEEIPRPAS
jgi:hypothetical protein